MRMIVLLLVVFVCGHSSAADNPTYTRQAELPPLRITYAELQSVIDKAHALCAHANASDVNDYLSEKTEVSGGSSTWTSSGHRLLADASRLPRKSTAFEYRYFAGDDSPISSLGITLREYSRTLSVSGTQPDQVDAIFSALRDELETRAAPIGGLGIKVGLGSAILFLLFIVFFVSTSYMSKTKEYRYWWMPTLSALLATLLFITPIGELFDGFLLFADNSSFLVRYAPQLAFVGLLLGLASLFVPLFRPTATATSPDGQPPGPPVQPTPSTNEPPRHE